MRNRAILETKIKDPEGPRKFRGANRKALAKRAEALNEVLPHMVLAFASSHNLECMFCKRSISVGRQAMRRPSETGYEWSHKGCFDKENNWLTEYNHYVARNQIPGPAGEQPGNHDTATEGRVPPGATAPEMSQENEPRRDTGTTVPLWHRTPF